MKEDVNSWIADAPKYATHLIVVCDTFSCEDYPVYVFDGQGEELNVIAAEYDGVNMQRINEIIPLPSQTETIKINKNVDNKVREMVERGIKHYQKQLEAINSPKSYVVNISSHWNHCGEKDVRSEDKTISKSVASAKNKFKEVNRRSDVQGEYTLYIKGNNDALVFVEIDGTGDILKKYINKS